MKHSVKDEELVRLYLHTRQNAYFEQLYKRYVGKVYRRCFSLTKNPTQAEDFTHDIFLRIHSGLSRFQERSAFATWLYAISYNYCMDQLRLTNRANLIELDESAHNLPDTNDTEHLEQRLRHLSVVMENMSLEETMLIRLKYEDDLDIKEIARQYNLKDSAIKMRLKRTRDKIRRMYFEYHD
ncbi:sigma-70 family RNA polymerase sigma factor [Rudanella paleaurantiibacter]|jgi:RNA polymerase sigma-70 factor (ECF subfamily)|uniref:Sigma-70 family RNA polymerase sigma factor n=1 Tax=Rudanella paleaurantiibacter TaxID=2614655 RepID=A0A7J5TY60_9BACT|nr:MULTISPECIES: sigma-70 family RNA polymerase sigma factor [Rudanella]KAB7730079.1 sigma-70 family RNA polymerase sigma factor [Rudanella paleaurantiibacter]